MSDANNSPALNKGDPADDYDRELEPNGGRINIGAYGNTPQASRRDLKTLSLSSPLGSPWGTEKWSRSHEILWAFHGTGWAPSDTIRLEYTKDGVSFFEITSGLSYITGVYSSWNTLSAAGDSADYQLKISSPGGPAFYAEDTSGFFTADNTPPSNVGCHLPDNGSQREPVSTTLAARTAADSPAGLNADPYYFQIDTTSLFNSPALQNSGWRTFPIWHPALQPNTVYYWRVNARDDADPVNERGFCGDADTVGTYWTFRTLGVYHATDIESATTGLRWIMDNVTLNPGDIVYVDAGTYPLSAPLEFSAADAGSSEAPVRITGYNGEVILDAGGMYDHCLTISGDYFQVENFAFTGALASGVLISGDHNTLLGGASYANGGDGIEATGDYTTIKNMRVYDNTLAGIHLFASHHSLIENNTSARNGTSEVFLEDDVPPAPTTRSAPPTAICSTISSGQAVPENSPLRGEREPGRVQFQLQRHLWNSRGVGRVLERSTLPTFAAWTGASFQDQSSLNPDPLFAPGTDDFHLLSTGGRWDGGSWTTDTQTSPGVDRGRVFSVYALESAPNGARINSGAYGNTIQGSRSPSPASGRNFYVNDADTEWDYYCTTAGLPWPSHDGLSPATPPRLDPCRLHQPHHAPGRHRLCGHQSLPITATITIPISGTAGKPLTLTGSPNPQSSTSRARSRTAS